MTSDIKFWKIVFVQDDNGVKILSVDPTTYKFLEEKRIREENEKPREKVSKETTDSNIEQSISKKEVGGSNDLKFKESKCITYFYFLTINTFQRLCFIHID